MKHLAHLVAVVFLATPASAQDWTTIELGVSSDIHSFNYGGFATKWVCGNGGFLAKTTDLQNWTIVDSGSTADFRSIVRWSLSGFLVGGGTGVVRKSGDTGATWVGVNIPDASQTFSLYSRSSGWANAVGDGGTIYQTRDAGATWTVVYSGMTPLHAGSGFIGSQSWTVGDGGLVLHTVDGGANWDVQPTGTSDNLYCFLEGGAGFIFAAGENGTILRSGDGGDTWERLTTGTEESIHDVRSSTASANIMLAVGDNGTVLRTTNLGDDWCVIDPETSANLLSVLAVNASSIVLGGENGLMLYTETGGGDCDDIVPVEPQPEAGAPIPPEIALTAPRPNPFGAATKFSFALPLTVDGADIRVSVFDVNGRLVRGLIDGPVRSGGYVITWDGTDDAGARVGSGVYFVRLSAGVETTHQRVTVVR